MSDTESLSPWKYGDRVMVTFEIISDDCVQLGGRSGMRLVAIVGDETKYSLPESCFIEASAFQLIDEPLDDWSD